MAVEHEGELHADEVTHRVDSWLETVECHLIKYTDELTVR